MGVVYPREVHVMLKNAWIKVTQKSPGEEALTTDAVVCLRGAESVRDRADELKRQEKP
jgi:hypothetical protein